MLFHHCARWRSLVGLLLSLALFLPLGLTLAAAQSYGEAPELRERVEAGELPPVEERLPAEPYVVDDVEEVGSYGGDWRRADLRPAAVLHDTIMRWNADTSEIVPNTVESVEVSEDSRVYTFHLREGMRWSDGHPHTAADWMFLYEHILVNEELSSLPWWTAGGEPGVFEALDDYTVRITFSEPYGLFLLNLTTWRGGQDRPWSPQPAHYMSQFHPALRDADELQAEVEAAGFGTWVELFESKWEGNLHDAQKPVMQPWVITETHAETGRQVVERNPYYWKVDREGNQLPYIDRQIYTFVEDVEIMNFMALQGDLDLQTRLIIPLEQLSVFYDNAERGDYRIIERASAWANSIAFSPNLNHPDPVLREILNDDRFRKALSVAIDREEIIELVFFGLVEPRQVSPMPGSPFYYPEHAHAYIDYDPEAANAMLDEMGLSERNPEGFRLRPDGQELRILIDVPTEFPHMIEISDLVQDYWQEVGVRTQLNVIDRSLLYTRKGELQHDFTVWEGRGMGADTLIDPRNYLPHSSESNHAIAYAQWWESGGELGEEPTGDHMRVIEIYEEILRTDDLEEQAALMRDILEINRQNLWVIGISSMVPDYGVAKNGLRNLPETLPAEAQWGQPLPEERATYFWAR